MAESDFSWTKVLSFFGTLVLFFIGIVTVSSGANLIHTRCIFNGIFTCLGGVSSIAMAVLIYRRYQQWSRARSTGKKL